MQIRPIHFVHRGRTVEVSGVSPTLSVLEWLRAEGCTGTKEGCAEGDCGACTVWVAELAPQAAVAVEPQGAGGTTARDGAAIRTGPLLIRPVNACIRFLPTLDGKALLTVEDLAGRAGCLHPAQQAMVECHASQCGFCTPGFVMSLAAVYEQHSAAGPNAAPPPSREALADAVAGNLCRCTGYRPILDAGQRMFTLGDATRQADTAHPGDARVAAFDAEAVAATLRALPAVPPLHYSGPHADGSGRTQAFVAPRTARELAQHKADNPQARLLAGSTDIGLWVNKQFRDLGTVLYLGDVAELREIRPSDDGSLHIGAAVPLEDAYQALVRHHPGLRELWRRFAGPPVRHAGTLVGNLANGSPIGDSAPALMALNAQLHLRWRDEQRVLPLDGFYTGYQRNQLREGEWVEAVSVPRLAEGWQLRVWKISKRHDCDISALCGAFALNLTAAGQVNDVRLAFGGMAATVMRAGHTEAALRGQAWDKATLARAQAALAQDFTPLSDLRASASYRLEAAAGLLERLWWQTHAGAPLDDSGTRVWSLTPEAQA